MKRLLTACLLLAMYWSPVAAEEEAPAQAPPPAPAVDPGPQALEGDGEPEPDPGAWLPDIDTLLPELGEEQIDAAVSENAAAAGQAPAARVAVDHPALDMDNVVPALLSVERQKQHATACQYWLKLENRLPFKIRSLALRFSAYVHDPNYEKPVLYDSDIKSFSELRPTDSQYRDVFYEYMDCSKIAYIQVQDTGRCAAGTMNKFSSQSGDCIRFVEIQPSAMLCIYADDGGQTDAVNPCGEVNEALVDALLARFVENYGAGDMDGFLALFSPLVETAEGSGHEVIRERYADLFASSSERALEVASREWAPLSGGSAEIRFNAPGKLHQSGGFMSRFFSLSGAPGVAAELKVRRAGDQLLITRFVTKERP